MTAESWKERYGLTTGKAIAIGTLVLVFAGVLIMQLLPETPSVTETSDAKPKVARRSKRKPSNRPAIAQPARTGRATASNSKATAIWPKMVSQNVQSQNPFAIPIELIPAPVPTEEELAQQAEHKSQAERIRLQEEQANRAEYERAAKEIAEKKRKAKEAESELARIIQKIERLQKSGVDMFLVDGKNNVASIEGKFVREGDNVDGIQVVKIRDDGTVVLKPAPKVDE